MVAGHESATSGDILVGPKNVTDLPPAGRNTAMMFQSYALFPHLSVIDNVAFALKMKGVGKTERHAEAKKLLELVDMQTYAARLPAQLSGGQQQRVALARMLATDPRVLLFDEPLSALDRNLRDTLKYSILALQRRTKKTAIYVTHDQSEAFAISDRIFVMNKGKIEQAGTQTEIYLHPKTEFVANFVGDNNTFVGPVVDKAAGRASIQANGIRLVGDAPMDLQVGQSAQAFVRPENIEVVGAGEGGDNVVEGTIEQIVFEGPTVRLTVDAHGTPIKINVGGPERLTLLDGGERKVRLRLLDVTIVPEHATV
jgi:ABC-type Fe3+/spermidine/putrescine transport system ATPase subunit